MFISVNLELTILMPCLNEAETIGICIRRARQLLAESGTAGEILISDNGSTDGSQQIAVDLGARVVHCPERGYGAALQYGIQNACGTYILMGDSDDSYHFDEAFPMIEELRHGADVCMGTRLKGRIMPGAMPTMNRILGNPALTGIGRLFFGISVSDFHCGMRAFRRDAILGLNLVTIGMEWASEMVIKARLERLSFAEVPITLYKDGRSRPPHLKPWRDGWRHLRFMLLHAPFWLFIVPGLAFITAGLLGECLLCQGMIDMGKVRFDVHTLFVSAILIIIGAQAFFSGVFVRLYSTLAGILPFDERFDRTVRRLTLEKLLIFCLVLLVIGGGGFLTILAGWYQTDFGDLDYQVTMRRLIPFLTLIALSIQGMFNGFMFSILFIKTKMPHSSSLE